jgi:hypothetical protein
MAKDKQTSITSIIEDIKAAEEAEAAKTQETQSPEPEAAPEGGDDDMPKAATWGSFKVETGIVPERAGGGSSKYDWASFPAPSDPEDPKTWPSVFIPGIGGKTIYGSIKAYRDKLQKDGKEAPEFTVSVSKEPKGVRVIRKK